MPRYFKDCSIHDSTKHKFVDHFHSFHGSRLSSKYRGFSDSFISLNLTCDPLISRNVLEPIAKSFGKKTTRGIGDRHPGLIHPYIPSGIRWIHEPRIPTPTDFLTFDSRSRSPITANELRWRNALNVYNEFDIWNQGYIDIQDAAEHLGSLPGANLSYVERLISILEDLKPHVSSRGVVEKCVAVQAIKRAIDESGLTNPVYRPLRGGTAFLNRKSRKKEMNKSKGFRLTECAFYKGGDLSTETVQRQIHSDAAVYEDSEINPNSLCRPALSEIRKRPIVIGGWGPVGAGLEEHGRITKERRKQGVEKIMREREEKENEEFKRYKFKPEIANKRFRSPKMDYTPRRRPLPQEELDKAIELVAPKTIRFCAEEITEDETVRVPLVEDPLGFQIYRAKNEKMDERYSSASELSDFVLHLGDPPAIKAVAWEESLRTDWERTAYNTQFCTKKKELQQQQFDPFSRKIREQQLERGLFSSTPNWTPKMAFDEVRTERRQKAESDKFLLAEAFFPSPHEFSAPYQPFQTQTENGSITGTSTKMRCPREISTRSLAIQKQQAANEEPRGQYGGMGSSIDDSLLLPQSGRARIPRGVTQKSTCGEISTGFVHPNRGYSDWIYNLRKSPRKV